MCLAIRRPRYRHAACGVGVLIRNKHLAVGLLLLLFVATGYFAVRKKPDLPIISCPDLSQACNLGEGLSVSADRPPQIMRPFRLSVTASETTPIAASFAMQGMDMGLNRYRLIKQENGSWAAAVTLPVCIQGRSSWLLELEMRGKQRHYYVAFNSR